MVSGLATQATCPRALRPSRLPISASVDLSGSADASDSADALARCGSQQLGIRSSTTGLGLPAQSRTPAAAPNCRSSCESIIIIASSADSGTLNILTIRAQANLSKNFTAQSLAISASVGSLRVRQAQASRRMRSQDAALRSQVLVL